MTTTIDLRAHDQREHPQRHTDGLDFDLRGFAPVVEYIRRELPRREETRKEDAT